MLVLMKHSMILVGFLVAACGGGADHPPVFDVDSGGSSGEQQVSAGAAGDPLVTDGGDPGTAGQGSTSGAGHHSGGSSGHVSGGGSSGDPSQGGRAGMLNVAGMASAAGSSMGGMGSSAGMTSSAGQAGMMQIAGSGGTSGMGAIGGDSGGSGGSAPTKCDLGIRDLVWNVVFTFDTNYSGSPTCYDPSTFANVVIPGTKNLTSIDPQHPKDIDDTTGPMAPRCFGYPSENQMSLDKCDLTYFYKWTGSATMGCTSNGFMHVKIESDASLDGKTITGMITADTGMNCGASYDFVATLQ